jgi:hypothetical protein
MALVTGIAAGTRLQIARGEVKLVAAMLAIVIAIQAAVLAADQLWAIDHYDLVRDPNAIANNPNYFGLISNLGIVLWIMGAVGALQAYAALRGRLRGHLLEVLFAGGIFAALMGLDDFFMLHESIATTGIPEPVVLIPHAIFLMVLCYHAFFVRGETPWLILAVAVAAFGLSMAVDLFPVAFGGQVFIEESFKLLGIVFLTAYLVIVSQSALRAGRA